MKPSLSKIVWAVILVLLFTSGCSRGITSSYGDAPNLERWMADIRARPPSPLEPLPVLKQFESFEYAAQDLRDPFSDAWDEPDTPGALRPDPNRRKEALEFFPLDSLKMVGTIGKGASMIGLVTSSDQVTHRINPGNYMGQNDGRVIGIDEHQIELVELISDGQGGWMERTIALSLTVE